MITLNIDGAFKGNSYIIGVEDIFAIQMGGGSKAMSWRLARATLFMGKCGVYI